LRATLSLCFLRLSSWFRFRAFAFAFCLRFAFLPAAPLHQHLTCGPSEAIGDRFASKHSSHFIDPPGLIEAADGGFRAPAIHTLFDFEVSVGVRRDLRQVRDAQDLKGRSERAELAANDISQLLPMPASTSSKISPGAAMPGGLPSSLNP
jgi:hypothetical protein